MKTLLSIFAFASILLSFASCKNETGVITVDTYLVGYLGDYRSPSELPEGGITIFIDTVSKTVKIPLAGKVGDDFIQSRIDTTYLPFYDHQKQEINYTINSWEHKPDNAIMFSVSFNDKTFRCAVQDSVFTIQPNNAEVISFYGGVIAKDANANMNKAKKQAFDSLTGN